MINHNFVLMEITGDFNFVSSAFDSSNPFFPLCDFDSLWFEAGLVDFKDDLHPHTFFRGDYSSRLDRIFCGGGCSLL